MLGVWAVEDGSVGGRGRVDGGKGFVGDVR